MIRTIIVDDEANCCKTLSVLLERDFPEVEVVDICHNGADALTSIRHLSPDLVFLDIEMPGMTGFEMLEKIAAIKFYLIFTTSYDQYALKAFRFSAVDYLLKPISKDELKAAVKKVTMRNQQPISTQTEQLLEKIKFPSQQIKRLAVPTLEGLQMVMIEAIVYAEADDNYTIFHFKDGRKVVVSLTLKDVEESLEEYSFSRVHRCYLVNLNEIERYVKGDGGYLVMSDHSTIDVSRTKKETLLKRLLPGK